MKQTIGLYEFREAFRLHERTNFSYEGLEVLFDALEQDEIDTGKQHELDVIALCCDFVEMTASEVRDYYPALTDWENLEEFLNCNTWICGSWLENQNKRFVFLNF